MNLSLRIIIIIIIISIIITGLLIYYYRKDLFSLVVNNKDFKYIIPRNIKPKFFKTNHNKIPKIIHKTFKTCFVSKEMYDAFLSWENLNPEYEINFYDNEDCEDFIIDNFPKEYIRTYRSLIPGAYKADFFRLCVLYIYGGIYSDIGHVCVSSIDELINSNDTFISAKDIPDACIQFSFLCCIPKHIIILKSLEQIITNVNNRYYGKTVLSITGPEMFGRVINKCLNRDEDSLFETGNSVVNSIQIKLGNYMGGENEEIIFDDKVYIKKYKNYNKQKSHISSMPNYGKLWCKKNVFNTYVNIPKIVHLIYIPLDKNNPYDFDKTYYYELQKNNLTYDIKLWTLPKLINFIRKYYNNYFDTIFNISNSKTIIVLLSILLVYHYGGIYLQYNNINKVSFDYFLPSEIKDKNIKLFTEKISRNNLEELIKVSNNVFSSIPKHLYLFNIFEKFLLTYLTTSNSDIFIYGNSLLNEFYNQKGQKIIDIELVELETNMIVLK